MNDLISRKALLDVMPKNDFLLSSIVRKDIVDAPAVNAEPVRHGKWIDADGMLPPEYHGKKYCSVCLEFALYDRFGRERLSQYCPFCGAKMDDQEKET